MRNPQRPGIRKACAATFALALVLPASSGRAQAPGGVNDYQLPSAPAPPQPPVSGPVDPENPRTRPATPTPTTPSPAPSLATPPAPAPQVTLPAQPAPVPAPRPTARDAETATPPTPRAPAETPQTMPPALASPEPSPAAKPAAASPATSALASDAALPWPWLAAGGLAALFAAGLVVLLRRRKAARASDEDDWAAPHSPARAREPSPPAALPKRPPPAPPVRAAASQVAPRPESARDGPIEISFEARHLSQAMVNASLAYRLSLTNGGDAPLGPLALAGDITSAHGSVPADRQLSPAGQPLAPIRELAGLAPGETAEIRGELRLPLAEIMPIHQGGVRVFVPLARFRVTGEGIDLSCVFVVGQAGAGNTLRPFLLDRGPGMTRGIGQRWIVGAP